jgi:HD-like signal output (HDOD) protein
MLVPSIKRKLESLSQIPTMSAIAGEVLHVVDNPNFGAARLSKLIERDQALAARVLSVANSPYYGFSRRISTINLAVVILGTDVIKEILLSVILKGFFSQGQTALFDSDSFWRYSVFCASTTRFLARKFGYRVAGEAFVAGLMHDIGVLIISQIFPKQLALIREEQKENRLTMVEAEERILKCTHSEIGAWVAEKWNLPEQLQSAILHHHTQLPQKNENIAEAPELEKDSLLKDMPYPLAALVATSEWLAGELGFKEWSRDLQQPPLYIPAEIRHMITTHDTLDEAAALELFKKQVSQEYERASILNELP